MAEHDDHAEKMELGEKAKNADHVLYLTDEEYMMLLMVMDQMSEMVRVTPECLLQNEKHEEIWNSLREKI